jgi:hypothetical protein
VEEITFRNKREDLEAYYDYKLKETEEGKRIGKRVFIARSWFAVLIWGLGFTLIWGILGYLGASLRSSVFLAIGCILVLLMATGLALLIMGFKPYYYVGKQILQKNKKSLTERDWQIFQLPRTVKIEEDWLEVRTSEAVHRWRWGLVDAIGLTPDFIFLHVGMCYIFYIPKRDFPAGENFLAFGNRLVDMANKNKDQPLAIG